MPHSRQHLIIDLLRNIEAQFTTRSALTSFIRVRRLLLSERSILLKEASLGLEPFILMSAQVMDSTDFSLDSISARSEPTEPYPRMRIFILQVLYGAFDIPNGLAA